MLNPTAACLALTLLLGTCCAAAPGAAAPATQPAGGTIVLLKLDDLSGKVQSHLKVAEWAMKEGLKINFGVFGKSLEDPKPEYIAWLKELTKSGNFELWNHGYGGFGNADATEGVSFEVQRDRIARTQQLSKKHLDEPFIAYGPHAAAMNADTWKAFNEFPEIKAVFGQPPAGWEGKAFAIRNRVALEAMPDLKPSKQRLVDSWNKTGKGKDYIFVQGHPNVWTTDADWQEVKAAVAFLKDQNCRFMTISEFLKTREKPTTRAAATPTPPPAEKPTSPQ